MRGNIAFPWHNRHLNYLNALRISIELENSMKPKASDQSWGSIAPSVTVGWYIPHCFPRLWKWEVFYRPRSCQSGWEVEQAHLSLLVSLHVQIHTNFHTSPAPGSGNFQQSLFAQQRNFKLKNSQFLHYFHHRCNKIFQMFNVGNSYLDTMSPLNDRPLKQATNWRHSKLHSQSDKDHGNGYKKFPTFKLLRFKERTGQTVSMNFSSTATFPTFGSKLLGGRQKRQQWTVNYVFLHKALLLRQAEVKQCLGSTYFQHHRSGHWRRPMPRRMQFQQSPLHPPRSLIQTYSTTSITIQYNLQLRKWCLHY